MTFSHHDTRPHKEKVQNLKVLDFIENVLSAVMSNYAVGNPENLFDLESHEILRKLEFTRNGSSTWIVVFSQDGIIKAMNPKTPRNLLVGIHNSLMVAVHISPFDL